MRLVLHIAFGLILIGVYQNTSAQKPFYPQDADYLWPTDASHYASASFGETRSAHFHAALDVKTWGRVGYKLYATRDGILYRVARGPFGYGNVIYLKHNDGSFSVYAHMDRFTPQLDKLVDSLRWGKRVFVFDENMEKFKIQYKRGQLIGYTGESGAGPPHLHFELRTPTESPFNPLITSISIKDKVAPSFSALAIEPIDKFAKVENQKKIFVKEPRRVGKNVDFGTIDVEGQVGLAVDVFDQASGVSNVYAVYELELKVDNQLLFHSKIDSFSYAQSRQMFLDRVYGLLKSQNKGFQRLYRHDGNTLPFYKTAKPEAKLNLSEGMHQFEITARDFYQNETKAYGKLRVKQPDSLPEMLINSVVLPPKMPGQSFPENLTKWDWQNDWVKPKGDSKMLSVKLSPMDFFDISSKYQLNTKEEQVVDLKIQNSVLLESEGDRTVLYRIEPGKTKTIVTPDQMLEVQFGAKAVYDTLSLSVGYYRDEKDGELYLYVLPEQEPLQSGFTVSFLLPDSFLKPEKTAFYQYNFRYDKLDFAPANTKGKVITAKLRDFGLYRVVTDSIAPVLSNPKIVKKSGGKWTVHVEGTDNLSGIDYNKSRFFVNDEEGILEFDPELNRIVYYHPTFRPKKKNKIELVVYDFEGNKTQQIFWLTN